MSRDFTKIKVWKLADELTVEVYRMTREFPNEELFALTSQLRRASCSVPANIAEGANRLSKREYLQFLSIASGSIGEVKYFLHLAARLGYAADAQSAPIHKLSEDTSKALSALITAVKSEVFSR